MYVCMYVCIRHPCVCVYIYMPDSSFYAGKQIMRLILVFLPSLCVHMCICMYVCMYVCTHVSIYVCASWVPKGNYLYIHTHVYYICI